MRLWHVRFVHCLLPLVVMLSLVVALDIINLMSAFRTSPLFVFVICFYFPKSPLSSYALSFRLTLPFLVYFFPIVLVSSQAVLRMIRPSSNKASQDNSVGPGRCWWGSGGCRWEKDWIVMGLGMGTMSGIRMFFWERNYLSPPSLLAASRPSPAPEVRGSRLQTNGHVTSRASGF